MKKRSTLREDWFEVVSIWEQHYIDVVTCPISQFVAFDPGSRIFLIYPFALQVGAILNKGVIL